MKQQRQLLMVYFDFDKIKFFNKNKCFRFCKLNVPGGSLDFPSPAPPGYFPTIITCNFGPMVTCERI